MKTTTKTGWSYEVTDGTKARPAGYVGTFASREEAEAVKAKKCRMGGYIKRVSGPAACDRTTGEGARYRR